MKKTSFQNHKFQSYFKVKASPWLLSAFLLGSVYVNESHAAANSVAVGLTAGVNASIKVKGKVVDEKGLPLPGVNVVIKGSKVGVATEGDGTFSLDVPNKNSILVFSFQGFNSQEIVVGSNLSFNVVLKESSSVLNDVVVIGYGTQRKKDLTGAVVSANLKQFEESPNTNILQSLQGSLPGITIGQTSAAGADPQIQVRGRSTLGGNTGVLVILDGAIYRGSFSDLNPADIQSVDVLKDPSSKAIYGAQAANGILMVTSKKGKSGMKTEISYSTRYTTMAPIQNRRTLNRAEFIESARREMYELGFTRESGFTVPTEGEFDYLGKSGVAVNSDLEKSINSGTDFNWYEAGQNANPHLIDHQLSIRGGSDKTTFFLSSGYTQQLGWVINDNFNRKSLRVNLDTQVNDWIKVGINTFGTFSDRSGEKPSLETFVLMNPLYSPTRPDGSFIINPSGSSQVNPFLNIQANDLNKNYNFTSAAYLSVDVPGVKGLNYRLNFNNSYRLGTFFNSNVFGANGAGKASKKYETTFDTAMDHVLSYDKRLGSEKKHGIKLTAIYGYNIIKNEFTTASATQFDNIALGYGNLGVGKIPLFDSGGYNEQFLSQTARVIYDYDGKYLFNASIRRDGHSAFYPGNKIGYFPAASAGWVLSKEKFLSKFSKIDLLKLRVSYGLNGNTAPRYSAQTTYSSDVNTQYLFGDNNQVVNSFKLDRLVSTDLTWEKSEGRNIGVDYGFFNNRITGSLDYYNTKTRDLLFDRNLSASSGVNSKRVNIGGVLNTGIEAAITLNAVRTKDWNWDLGFNISKNDNKITSLTGQDLNKDGVEDDLIQNGYFIGKSIGTVYTFVEDGIYQLGDNIPAGFQPGSFKFKDLDNNGILLQSDKNVLDEDGKVIGLIKSDRTHIGRREADYQFGITNNLTYKNFSLKFFINSVQGGLGANNPWGGTAFYGSPSNYVASNRFSDIDYWSPNNPNAEFPKATSAQGGINFDPFRDKSFVRLQDISFSYTFDKKLIKKIGLNNLKLFVSGKNLMTWTKWKGWDPETGAGLGIGTNEKTDTFGRRARSGEQLLEGLPVMKSFNLGLDVSF